MTNLLNKMVLLLIVQIFAIGSAMASNHVTYCYDSDNKPVFKNIVDQYGHHTIVVDNSVQVEEVFHVCFYTMDNKTVLAGSAYQQIEIAYSSASNRKSGEYRIGSCLNGDTCGCIFGKTNQVKFTCD